MIRTRLQAFRRSLRTLPPAPRSARPGGKPTRGTSSPASGTAAAAVLGAGILLGGCSEDPASPRFDEIDPIVFSQHVLPVLAPSCNTAFCHNRDFRAAGLSLETFEDLAEGSDFGAMVIPYKPEASHFYLHLTGAIEPRMPLQAGPLPADVVAFLRRWIEEGAKDDGGTPMYSGVTRKAFVACQGENTVAVVDMTTGLTARYLDVDQPHSVYVDPVTRRLYVSRFQTASDNIQVYDADTHRLVTTGRAGTFPALMALVRPPARAAQLWVTNFDTNANGDHAVRVLDPVTLEPIASFELDNAEQPHGIAVTRDQTKVYVCNIGTATVTVFGTDSLRVEAFPVALPDAGGISQQPQSCVLSADESRLFVSALGADRIHVFDTTTNTFLPGATVTVGDAPWHMSLSPDGSELWVANWVESSVSILDVTDPDQPFVITTLAPSHPVDADRRALQRPIGIGFSPDGSRVYVTSANDDNAGSGHHPAPEGEKNPGNVVIFDAATREVLAVAEVPNFARFVSFLP